MSQQSELVVVQDDRCATCLAKEQLNVSRRSFFASLLGMGTAVVGAMIGLPLVKFVLYPVQSADRKRAWSEVGKATEFEEMKGPVVKTIALTQRDGWREVVSQQSVFVSRAATGELQVLSSVCPHLGCAVSWHDDQKKFICPCHGGQFSADGSRISGPPPRGLDRLDAQVKDGKLQVQFEYFRSNVPNRELLS